MNLLGSRRIFHAHLVNDDKLGKKDDWVTTPIQLYLTLKNLVSQSSKGKVAVRKRSEIDHGLFVHGIKNALAT